MTVKIIDDKFDSLDDDILKLQYKPTTYISYTGDKGIEHLTKEAINNSIDECGNKNSIGKTINIFIDEVDSTVMTSDNSRGIPFDKLEEICTKMHSGSKITREGTGGGSAGENGIGLTAINALSEEFELVSTRNGESASIKFRDGKKVQDLTIVKADSNEHGTVCKFKPTKKYLGKNPKVRVPVIYEWIKKISYTIDDGITIILDVNRVGREASIHKIFKNKGGMLGLIKLLFSKDEELALEPIYTTNNISIPEEIIDLDTGKGKIVDRFFGIEMALSYKKDRGEIFTDSFCNNINTIDDGTHVDGTREAIDKFFKKKIKDSFTDKEAKILQVTNVDIYNGLCLLVNIRTDASPGFASQTKEKIGSMRFKELSRELTLEALENYFEGSKELKKYCDFIKTSIKMRMSLLEAKKSVMKNENISNVDKYNIDKFSPCNNKGKEYKELILLEGDSAKGSINNARYKDFQALYALGGVPPNTFDMPMSKILTSKLKSFLKVLGTNVGSKFDINKLEWDKIIIMPDADVDGKFITSLVCVLLVKHLHQLVEAGKVYICYTPLYKFNDKDIKFAVDKIQHTTATENKIYSKLRIFDINSNIMYNREMFNKFMTINKDYLGELIRVSKNLSIHRMLLERLVMHINDDNINEKVQKYFPEIIIEDGYLKGIVEGSHQVLVLDKIFYKKIKNLVNYIHVINKDRMCISVCDVENEEIVAEKGIMTIGEFLIECSKYSPELITRYKGLGELSSSDLRDTTMNPNNRVLKRLTLNDLKDGIESFEMLHGKKGKDRRKEFMRHAKISRDEFDN